MHLQQLFAHSFTCSEVHRYSSYFIEKPSHCGVVQSSNCMYVYLPTRDGSRADALYFSQELRRFIELTLVIHRHIKANMSESTFICVSVHCDDLQSDKRSLNLIVASSRLVLDRHYILCCLATTHKRGIAHRNSNKA